MKELTKVEVVLSQWIKEFTEGRETGVPVPCGECRACCINLNAQLYQYEEKMDFRKKWSKKEGKYHLKHKANGECTYLTSTGCSIHQRVPKVCRTFDCRLMGYFNILDPHHDEINKAAKRWLFVIDNLEMYEYSRRMFEVGVNMLPVKAGDPVDRVGKAAIYFTYEEFFVRRKE